MAKLIRPASPTSVILRVKLMDSTSTTGAGKTGLLHTSAGLKISFIKANGSGATTYTQAGSTIEAITGTFGTYQTPTTGKVRFNELDATNHPGIYEIHANDSMYDSTIGVLISLSGATGLAQADFEIQTENIAVQVKGIDANAITAASIASSALTLAKLASDFRVKLDATQGDYAPAKAGDAMALTSGERTTLTSRIWDELLSVTRVALSFGQKFKDAVFGTSAPLTAQQIRDAMKLTTGMTGVCYVTDGVPAFGIIGVAWISGDKFTHLKVGDIFYRDSVPETVAEVISDTSIRVNSAGCLTGNYGFIYYARSLDIQLDDIDVLIGLPTASLASMATDILSRIGTPPNTLAMDMASGFTAGAKDATVSKAAGTKGTDAIYDEVITQPTLAEINASTVLAKEATLTSGFSAGAKAADLTTVDTVVDAIQLQTDKMTFTGSNINSIKNASDALGTDFSAIEKASITLAVEGATIDNVNVASIDANAIDAASIKADAVIKIQSGLASQVNLDIVQAWVSSGRIKGLAKCVDKVSGSDLNSGNDWSAPYATIGAAITALTSSGEAGIIFVKWSQYFENIIVPANCLLVGYGSGTHPVGDITPEIRGLAGGAETNAPTLTLMEGAKALGIRVGRYASYSEPFDCLIRMYDDSEFLNGSTGGQNRYSTSLINIAGSRVKIKGNLLNTSNKALNPIDGAAPEADIENNIFLYTGAAPYSSNFITITGEAARIQGNKFTAVPDGCFCVKTAGTLSALVVKDNVWSPQNVGAGVGEFISMTGITLSESINNEQYAKETTAQAIKTQTDKLLWDVDGNVLANTQAIGDDALLPDGIYGQVITACVDALTDTTVTLAAIAAQLASQTAVDSFAIEYDFSTYSKSVVLFYDQSRPFAGDADYWCYVYTSTGGRPTTSAEIGKRDKLISWATAQPA